MDYNEFLNNKIAVAPSDSGISVDLERINPKAKPHQRDTIQWALLLGRALGGLAFGLGKTYIQTEIARILVEDTGKSFLVICPLGVKHQFTEEDGPALNVDWQYVRSDAEVESATTKFLITNYERVRDGGITKKTIDKLCGVSLDEGSVLRNLGSKTSLTFRELLKNVEYRYVFTATPAPNDYLELIYYADFLGVMDRGQIKTRFFKRDPKHVNALTLMPTQEDAFWKWVATWALFLSYPSDLGHSDDGYILPELVVHWERLPVDHQRAWEQIDDRGQRRMLLSAANGISEASQEKRATIGARLDKAKEIMATNPGRHWLIWHHMEDERHAIEKAIPESVSVYGSQDLETREKRILQFSRGEIPILATKPEIAGSGCNFQKHCHSAIFLGVSYKFEEFIQAVHRIQRFLQSKPVEIWILYAESEDAIVDVMRRKWTQHNKLVERMRDIIRTYNLSNEAIKNGMKRKMGVTRIVTKQRTFTAIRNDCVLEMQEIGSNSVGMVLTSIPFGNHYEYSDQFEDFGHNQSDQAFWEQMDYLIPELLRVTMPGRIAVIHVKDRVLHGHQSATGIQEISPFSDECVMAFKKHGWGYMGRRTVVTDVVRENNQSYRLGYSEMRRDASKMGCGLPEYLLIFRKRPSSTETARADIPVIKGDFEDYSLGRWQVDAHGFWRSNGNRLLLPEEFVQFQPDMAAYIHKMEQLNGPYDYERHVKICETLADNDKLAKDFMLLPPKITRSDVDMVWDNVILMRTLNNDQQWRKKERHICPMPFDMVERSIRLYSNEDDLILDPFAGLFTVPYCAIKLGRNAMGIELNQEYYQAGVRYCQDAEIDTMTPTLFDLLKETEA